MSTVTTEWIILTSLIIVFYLYRRHRKRHEDIANSSNAANLDEIDTIIHKYGEIFELTSNNKEEVSDERDLLHPKPVIKTALKYALLHAPADDPSRKALESGFVLLSRFQANVPDYVKKGICGEQFPQYSGDPELGACAKIS